jgi:hypothetical protein
MELLSALDQSAFSKWLLSTESVWAYPTVLTLHTFGMMVAVGSASVISLRLLGFGGAIPLGSMRRMFSVIWAGLTLNAITGTMLFIANATQWATLPLFFLKLLLVAAALAIVVMIKRTLFGRGAEPANVNRGLKALALASLFAWGAAIVAGRLLAYAI